MQAFEKEFSEKFPAIRKNKWCKAYLFYLYPSMRCVGMRGTMPMWVSTGKSLYDVSGWLPATIDDQKVAIAIGIELKATKQRHPSLAIVRADRDGDGIQEHQLEALAALHRDGGIAKLLWNNGGIVGVMDGQELNSAFYNFGVSLAVEKMRKTPARGSRSIRWDMFRQVNLDEKPESVVMAPKKEPTLAQTLQAKRKAAAKLIEKAELERAERADAESFVRDEQADIDTAIEAGYPDD